MKHLVWILLFALVPMAETEAQVRVRGGVTVRFGDGRTTIVPRVRVDIGGHGHRGHHGYRGHRRQPVVQPPQPRGHYEIVRERVWVPPVYQYRYGPCGERIRYCVRRGYWKVIERRVWVPASPPCR